MELKNIFKMTKTDRYTQDGRDELAKLQETEDVRYKTGDISQKTGLQKQPDGSWAPPKKGGKPAAKKEAGSINRTPERIAKETAIMEALNLSTGEDNNLHKMSDETIERLYARTQEKPAAGKTTIRQGPNTKTLDEPPGEHIQKNLDSYRGYKPGDMEGLVLGPSGYKKQSSSKGPDGVSSITYTKEGEEDIVLSFDKYGELKNAGTSHDREGVMKKMQAAEGLGHMKVIGDYDVYRVTSGPDKGKYKVSKVGSLKEVTMSEQKAADFLSSAAVGNKSEKTKDLMEKYKDLPGAQKKDALYASTFEGSSIGMTQTNMERNGWDLVQADDDVNVYAKPDGSKVTMKHDGKKITSSEYEAPGSKPAADFTKYKRDTGLNLHGKSAEEGEQYMKENGFELVRNDPDYKVYKNEYGEEYDAFYTQAGVFNGGSHTKAPIPNIQNHKDYQKGLGNKYLGQKKFEDGTITQVYLTPEGKYETSHFTTKGEYNGGSTSSKEFYDKWYGDWDLEDSAPRILTGDTKIRIRK